MMRPGDDGYRILHDLQKKCCELNRKIDSILRMMEMLTTYMQYSGMMAEMSAATLPEDIRQPSEAAAPEGNGAMEPGDLQKLMNLTKSSNQPLSEQEFQHFFDELKKGKSEEEIARMEQMVKLARSFMR